MKKFKRRFAFAGLVFALVCGAGGTVFAAAGLAKIPLYHHHSEACIGFKEVETEADEGVINTMVEKSICPHCGGEVHYYTFRAECSCGEVWNAYGYACQNSIYGDNPGGGCTNYSKVNTDTRHTHMVETLLCGKEEDTMVGEISIEASETEPVFALTLTAKYSGTLAEPEYEWIYEEEGKEGSEEEGEAEGKDIERPRKSSSISVEKNGIYTLTAAYEEDGVHYVARKSVTISNIKEKEPEPPVQTNPNPQPEKKTKVSPAFYEEVPTPPGNPERNETESGETEEKTDEEDETETPETFVIRPLLLENLVAEVLEEDASAEPAIVFPEEEPEKGGVLAQAGRYFYNTWRKMPTETKIVTVSTAGLIGAVMVAFGTGVLGKTASVYWVDEKKRKHFMEKARIRKGIGKYEIHIRKEAIRLARTENICVKMPGIFTLLHKYHPIGVFCEDSMYSLHVERNIYITAA